MVITIDEVDDGLDGQDGEASWGTAGARVRDVRFNESTMNLTFRMTTGGGLLGGTTYRVDLVGELADSGRSFTAILNGNYFVRTPDILVPNCLTQFNRFETTFTRR